MTRLLQALFSFGRTQTFVHPANGQIESAMQLVAEAATALCHFVFGAIQMGWQSNNNLMRLPLGE